jgi:hypothetical protein
MYSKLLTTAENLRKLSLVGWKSNSFCFSNYYTLSHWSRLRGIYSERLLSFCFYHRSRRPRKIGVQTTCEEHEDKSHVVVQDQSLLRYRSIYKRKSTSKYTNLIFLVIYNILILIIYNNNNSIQFIYVQNLTAQRPITKLAQARKWAE